MRITQGMLNQQMIRDLQINTEQLSRLQQEVSTGKRINTPADDPVGVGYVMRYSNELAYYQQATDNTTAAQGWLNYTQSTMNEAGQVMQRARDLAVQGASDTLTGQDRTALAAEVDQLYQQLVTIGNSQYNGKYIFNGEMTNTSPYQGNAASVLGSSPDGGQVLFDIGGTQLNANTNASQYFGSPTTPTNATSDNAFAVLQRLETALNSNDTATISNTIGQIDSRFSAMEAVQADIGARLNRVQLAQNRLGDLTQNVSGLLSSVQDADMGKVITDLKSAENVQTASLEVGARVLLPTLVDFLK